MRKTIWKLAKSKPSSVSFGKRFFFSVRNIWKKLDRSCHIIPTFRHQVSDMQHEQLEQTVKALHRDAYIWARQCCRFDDEMAKDVLQQVYLKILESKAVYGGKSSVKTWLFSVIRFTANGSMAQANAILPLLEDYDVPDEVVSSDADRSPEELIQLLPAKQREVLLLVFYHGLTLEKAAEVMEIGLGTVRTHYDRGKKNLKKLIEKSRIEQ
jgi:RNA polymerase sigma factor (sigma-70 family)